MSAKPPNRHHVTVKMIGKAEKELIILKDEEKEIIDYADTPETEAMRENVRLINDLLGKTEITLKLVYEDFPKDPETKKIRPVDFTRKIIHRVFNKSSFDLGGRFYGGWWQDSIPREFRRYIVINGWTTEELDYSGLHIRLLYADEGISYESSCILEYHCSNATNRIRQPDCLE